MNHSIATAQATFVCTNNDQGDGTPCPWYGRERRITMSRPAINIGQGLLIQPAILCECGAYLHDQGVSVQEISLPSSELPADPGAPGKGPT